MGIKSFSLFGRVDSLLFVRRITSPTTRFQAIAMSDSGGFTASPVAVHRTIAVFTLAL
jgi:hypothetical protein